MNFYYNRDLKYSFIKRCNQPIHSFLIDDEWIKEKNIEMDIILPFKNIDVLEDENQKRADPSSKKWNDIGVEELLKNELDKNDLYIK